MMQTLLVEPLARTTEAAAATAIRNTGARLLAAEGDIDLVLAVLFDEVLS